jgi:hypothetical protein
LVQGLLALVMAATHTAPASAANRVDFVDKDNAWSILFGFGKEIAYARSTDTDKHFDKFGTRDTKEWHPCFTGNCTGKHGFTGTRRADQQDAFWNLGANVFKLFWVLQKVNNFD